MIYRIVLTILVVALGVNVILLANSVHNLVKKSVKESLPTPPVPRAPQNYGTVVRLVQDNKTFCSGAVVSDDIVITAGHCVASNFGGFTALNSDPVEVRASDNISRNTFGKAIYYSPQLDHAVLKGNFKIYPKFRFIDDPTILRTLQNPLIPFTACGYPMGGDLFCTPLRYRSTAFFMWSVEGMLIPGMSGGPVLTTDGVEIGINDAVDQYNAIITPLYNIHQEF